MIVEELKARAGPEWNDYVEAHPRSTCYHLEAWRQVGRRAYRLRAPFLIARGFKGDRIRGILPLFCVPGPVESHVTSGLFGAYGGLLADDPFAARSLLDRAQAIFEAEGAKYFVVKCLADSPAWLGPGFVPNDSWVIATLPLPRTPGQLWAGFRDKIRNCVRKAERYRLEVRSGSDQLESFYDVLAENMHRKGAPIYGLRFMREIVRAMGDGAEVVTLWRGSRAVSGALALHHRQRTYVPFASSRPSALSMCPNNLLYWELLRRSCQRGMSLFDFGSSLRGSGSLAFKLGWGARVVPLRFFVRSARDQEPRLSPDEPLVSWFVQHWPRLPRPVADAVGPWVCRRWLA